MKKISVARALKELKTLDMRLGKITSDIYPVVVKTGKKISGNKTQEEFSNEVKASMDQYKALLINRQAMKSAIVKSNAETKVMIGSVEMTVAEAIEYKGSISIEKSMINKLLSTFSKVTAEVDRINLDAQRRADQQAPAVLGKESNKNSADYENFIKTFMENNEAKMVDPLNVLKVVQEMGSKLQDFEDNVDIALSESNARTEIEVAE